MFLGRPKQKQRHSPRDFHKTEDEEPPKKSVVKPMVSGPRGVSIHVQKGFHLLHPTPQKTLPSHCEVPPTSHLRCPGVQA